MDGGGRFERLEGEALRLESREAARTYTVHRMLCLSRSESVALAGGA